MTEYDLLLFESLLLEKIYIQIEMSHQLMVPWVRSLHRVQDKLGQQRHKFEWADGINVSYIQE